MKILVSNDDGVYHKGLRILADSLREIAEVVIVAPDRDRSGASNSLTLDVPVRAKTLEENVISVEGTPTDCVHLAVTGLFNELPDMVVSGINSGANLGDDILYSGTVAAATEGRFLGLPAIAVSLARPGVETNIVNVEVRHYETAALTVRRLIDRLVHDPLPADTILNVNVPDVPFQKLKGFEVTRLGTRHRAEPIVKAKDPHGRPIYWIGPAGIEADAGPGTDFYALKAGKVSITPLKIDLTNYKAFDQVACWVESMEL